MQISSTTRPQKRLEPQPKAQAPESSPSGPRDGYTRTSETTDWLYAGASLVGGLASVAGGISGNTGLTGGGMLVTAASTALSTARMKSLGMDQAGLVSYIGGGTLIAASALLAFAPEPASPPNGPLPQLIRKFGFHGL